MLPLHRDPLPLVFSHMILSPEVIPSKSTFTIWSVVCGQTGPEAQEKALWKPTPPHFLSVKTLFLNILHKQRIQAMKNGFRVIYICTWMLSSSQCRDGGGESCPISLESVNLFTLLLGSLYYTLKAPLADRHGWGLRSKERGIMLSAFWGAAPQLNGECFRGKHRIIQNCPCNLDR